MRKISSLKQAFAPNRVVALLVKRLYGFTRFIGLVYLLKTPLCASVTLWEASAPDKLPNKFCQAILFISALRLNQR